MLHARDLKRCCKGWPRALAVGDAQAPRLVQDGRLRVARRRRADATNKPVTRVEGLRPLRVQRINDAGRAARANALDAASARRRDAPAPAWTICRLAGVGAYWGPATPRRPSGDLPAQCDADDGANGHGVSRASDETRG